MVLEDFVSDPAHPELSGAYQLFRGLRDTVITQDAQFFDPQASYPLLRRFYLKDEPHYNGYQPFNYVDQMILNIPGGFDGSATGRGRGITATPTHSQGTSNVNASFTRFMNDGRSYELFVDAYPIHADVSAPTSYISISDATAAGIATDTSNYTADLQGSLGWMITNSFRPAIEVAQSSSVPWWYIAQAHGELSDSTGQYRKCDGTNDPMLRPPSPEEIRCMVNLALAYGAKGIFYFWFPSSYEETNNFGGCSQVHFPGLVAVGSENGTPNHSSNYDIFDGHTVFTGYQKKYAEVKAINTILATLGPILVNRDWVTAFTSGENAPGQSIVTSINVGASGYIEAATFDSDYIMLVNRKCHPSDVQTIEITTNKSGQQWLMEDQLTHELFVSSNGVFKNILMNSGQGRLFKLRALTTNENWSGTINVANGITIAGGSTLTIQPNATLKFSSGASLTISGRIISKGTSTQRITFTGTTATPGFWNGIIINADATADTLQRCDIQYAVNGIYISYTGNSNDVKVEKCKIRYHSADGVTISGNGYSGATVHHLIKDNTISNNYYGFELYDYAQPTITGNRIENNTGIGIFGDSNCNATVEYNYIVGNSSNGLSFVISCNAAVHRNTITSNGSRGINCSANSTLLGCGANTDTTKGRNEIASNSGAGIYASNSSPNFGNNTAGFYGNNWIHNNTGYEAQQSGAGYQIYAKSCYWSGLQSDVSGTVYTSPVLGSAPSPVGWGRSTSYDPTYLKGFQPEMIAEVPIADSHHDINMRLAVNIGTNGTLIDWTEELKAAIEQGLNTGDWSKASELLAALHRELQEARVPNVDFALINTYANDRAVASFIRKMLALVLMENDLAGRNFAAALAKLVAFRQSNPENAAELLANAGVIHLWV